MVREIISVHIGQAGCNVGTSVWDLITFESGLDHRGFLKEDDNIEAKTVDRETLFSEKSGCNKTKFF